MGPDLWLPGQTNQESERRRRRSVDGADVSHAPARSFCQWPETLGGKAVRALMTTEQRIRKIRSDRAHLPRGKPRSPGAARRDRAERIVALFRLLADGRQWPAKDLSAALQVTVRTIQRDMQLLQAEGLARRQCGRFGGYQLVQVSTRQPPRLTPREMVDLLLLTLSSEPRDGGSRARDTVLRLIAQQPVNFSKPLLRVAHLMRSHDASAAQPWRREEWLGVLLEGLVETRPLKVWIGPSASELPAAPLEIVPCAIELRDDVWILQAHPISTVVAEVVLNLAQVAAVQFASQSS